MNCTGSESALEETCVCTQQTSEPRIHPETLRTDGPEEEAPQHHRYLSQAQSAAVMSQVCIVFTDKNIK